MAQPDTESPETASSIDSPLKPDAEEHPQEDGLLFRWEPDDVTVPIWGGITLDRAFYNPNAGFLVNETPSSGDGLGRQWRFLARRTDGQPMPVVPSIEVFDGSAPGLPPREKADGREAAVYELLDMLDGVSIISPEDADADGG